MKLTCSFCAIDFDVSQKGRSVDRSKLICPNCLNPLTGSDSPDSAPPVAIQAALADRYTGRDGTDTSGGAGGSPGTAPLRPHQILSQHFGYHQFREHQREIIQTLLAGRDAFALMPTGSGKSICYQIPAIIRPGVGVVISPLIALMQDQVAALHQNGIRADFLNSSLSAGDARRVRERLLSGQTDILYVAPERLVTDSFQRLLTRVPLALFAIDEAHCVSQWGHDFRPEYLQISAVTETFPQVPRIAMTATADLQTRKDIVDRLHLTGAERFISSFDRTNIQYQVQLKSGGKRQLLDFIRNEHPDDAGIVYVRTRKRADSIADWLQENGLSAFSYHAGLEQQIRFERQRHFLRGEGVIIVATIAFGMGIDKPDVRFVAHLDLPASMEAYYQETGRAGRDGQAADAWMVYSLADVVARRKIMELSDGSEAFKHIQQRKLDAFLGFCESTECRRKVLLDYFGEAYSPPCDHCDNCLRQVDTWDGTVAAQKALSCVYRTGQRFGAAHLVDVLIGNASKRVLQLGHNNVRTFGAGVELSKMQWHAVFRQLLAAGYLTTTAAQFTGFRLTPDSWKILRGEQGIQLRKDPEQLRRTGKPKKAPAFQFNAGRDYSPSLFEKLRKLRMRMAKELGVPPYVVFHDKTLKEMAAVRPATRQALLQISGVGQTKAERFGDQFLKEIAKEIFKD